MVMGKFKETQQLAGSREVRLLLLNEMDPDEAHLRTETLGLALSAMEERFGRYPYGSYAIVELPEEIQHHGWGASSEQGFIMASEGFVRVQGGNLPLFAHEAAHGWWGNLIDGDGPGSILLSESLSQYGAVIAIESVEGPEQAAEFLKFSRPGYVDAQCARGYFEIVGRGTDRALSGMGSGGLNHTLADAKGHWFFHMLRRRVGDETFFGTLQKVLDEDQEKSLTLDLLRQEFVAAAPDADLVRFFQDWLDRAGAPILDLGWTVSEGGRELELVIQQLQPGEPFRLLLDLAVETEAGETEVHQVDLREQYQRFRVPISGPPADVILDPQDRLLIWKPAYGRKPGDLKAAR